MFSIIRLIIGCLLICGILFILQIYLKKKNKTIRPIWMWLIIIVGLILTSLTALIPFENKVTNFESPEQAYTYVHPYEIELVLDGEISTFVSGKKDDITSSILIIPKDENGWKVGRGIDINSTYIVYEGITINVYQYKDTCDYYFAVSDVGNVKATVTDNRNSSFIETYNYLETTDGTYYSYYTYTSEPDSEYTITVNGTNIPILDAMQNHSL